MTRPSVDLRYEHEMRAVPSQSATLVQPRSEARTLVARLRGLKALMDAERGHFAAWIAATPGVALS